MVRANTTIFLFLLVVVPIMVGVVLLQIRLSWREGRIPGLILPILAFLLAMIPVLNVSTGVGAVEVTYIVTSQEGEIFRYADGESAKAHWRELGEGASYESQTTGGLSGSWVTLLAVFLLSNIPTVVLLLIYFVCRSPKRQRQQDELDKMRIDDLG